MKLLLSNKFKKDYKKIKDRKLLDGIATVVEDLENAHSIQEIKGIKKLNGLGLKNIYRIKRKELNDHRITFIQKDETIILELVRVLHRKDVYKKF